MRNLIFIFLLVSFCSFAQINADRDYNYYIGLVNNQLAGNDLTRSRALVDSLLPQLTDRSVKIEFLIISSKIYSLQSEIRKGIYDAEKGLKLAEMEGDFVAQARLCGILGTHYRWINLLDKGRFYLSKGLSIADGIDDAAFQNRFRANVYHESGEIALMDKDYPESIRNFDLAIQYLLNESDEEYRIFGLSQILAAKGKSFIYMKRGEKALDNFNEAWAFAKEINIENNLFGFLIQKGKAEAFLNLKVLDSAEVYLNIVEAWSQNNPENLVTLWNYNTFREFYKIKRDAENYYLYDDKINELYKKIEGKYSYVLNDFVLADDFNYPPEKNPSRVRLNVYLIVGLVVAALLGLWIYFNFYTKSKNSVGTASIKINTEEKLLDSNINRPVQLSFSEETADEIKNKIKKFVLEKAYLDQEMTFSKMTGMINTNTKYLNEFLKSHANSDYATFINNLRINYLIERLKEHPETRSYKLTYLAELSGFSSYSAFVANFRRVTGHSPSDFINQYV